MGKFKKMAIGVGAALALSIGAAAPAFATVVNVGGGTWNYGTSVTGSSKYVWSNYVHPTKYQSSTAIIGSKNVKKFANATVWSNANATDSSSYTGYTYWSTY